MNILLCSATEFEISPTLAFLKDHPGISCKPLITGLGLLAATHSITKAVVQNRPDFVLQAGIAGTLDLNLPLTKVVVVESDYVGDLGVMENGRFRTVVDMGFQAADEHPFTGGGLINPVQSLARAGLTLVKAVTVNQISTNPQMIEYYRSLGIQIESMEGAALHYVALKEGIRFLQLRSLSNFAGERDKSKWMTGMAIARLNDELIRILEGFA